MASWRDVLPIHPAADLFPLMVDTDPAALNALGKDIIKNGLASPIVLWSDGKSPAVLLDGRNRLDAVEKATGSPVELGAPSIMAGKDFLAINKVITLDRSVDPYSFVISANIHRRHLSIEDKDRLIVKVLQADPTKSNRTVAKLTDTSYPHVAKVRKQAEKVGDVEIVSTSIDSKGRQQPARKTATKRGTITLTPERMDQIRNLVERGKSRDEIAEIIGVTVGALQVACARAGISLRKPLPAVKPSEDAASREDIGPDSTGEIARKDAEIEELRNAKRMLEIKFAGLESEIEELESKLRQRDLTIAGLRRRVAELEAQLDDIPAFLDRTREATS